MVVTVTEMMKKVVQEADILHILKEKKLVCSMQRKAKRRRKKKKGIPDPYVHFYLCCFNLLIVSTFQLGVILLSEAKREQIKQLLVNSTFLETFFITDDGSYDHIGDSSFKRDFMRIIHGNIEDKLKVRSVIKKDDKLDLKLLQELENKIENNYTYKRMLTVRKKLPAYSKEQEILDILDQNQVLVISGETGCGKTTQVAQFILDDYIKKGKGSLCRIVCTQPRRISAVSVATRVAEERGESLGISVGYQIRLER